MTLVTRLGALEFRLKDVRTGMFHAGDEDDILLLDDGTGVKRCSRDGRTYLLVDHRTDPSARARIEFWESAEGPPEAPLAGLYALCDAMQSGIRCQPTGEEGTSRRPGL